MQMPAETLGHRHCCSVPGIVGQQHFGMRTCLEPELVTSPVWGWGTDRSAWQLEQVFWAAWRCLAVRAPGSWVWRVAPARMQRNRHQVEISTHEQHIQGPETVVHPAYIAHISAMWQPIGSGPAGVSCSSQPGPMTLHPAPDEAAHALRPTHAQKVPLTLQANC